MKIEMVSLIFLLLVGFFDLIQIGLCCPSFFRLETSQSFADADRVRCSTVDATDLWTCSCKNLRIGSLLRCRFGFPARTLRALDRLKVFIFFLVW
jgi:hypothetical protein